MKPLSDYSFVKGVNYHLQRNDEILCRDLGYAARLGVNSVRIWLEYDRYESEGTGYIQAIRHFVQVCHKHGVTVMPILFNGNGLNASVLEESFFPQGEAFASAVVEAIKTEPGLIMYDIMNEPPCNGLILEAPDEETKNKMYEKIWRFVRHFCKYVKSIDPENAITVGNWLATDIDASADLVDIISYHDYSPTLKGVRETAELALSKGKQYGKPVINNETCCIARANPYDRVIETLNAYHIPWYVFNLMIEGYWNDVHGIFYSDGTVRDPAIAAAMIGCFRNRDIETLIPEKPNREQFASKALEKLSKLLLDSHPDAFSYHQIRADDLLEVCEEIANLLECGQLTAMQIPPTARIEAWRKSEKKNIWEIKKFAYSLAKELKSSCQII